MSATARAMPPAVGDALIEHCEADFVVTAPRGPMSSPEGLLDTLRHNLLPVLSEVLEAPEWQGFDLTIPQIDIDLGDWPDDPVWGDVRYVFAVKLRNALEQHLPQRDHQNAARALQPSAAQRGASAVDVSVLNPQTGPAAAGMEQARTPSEGGVEKLHDPMPDPSQGASNRASDNKTAHPSVPTHTSARHTSGTTEHDPSRTSKPVVPARGSAIPAAPKDMGGASHTTAGARLGDREILVALEAFQQWLAKQARGITAADVLSHLAGHPAQVRGLIVWQEAAPVARQKALPAAAGQPAVSQAAARLATHASPASASPPPSPATSETTRAGASEAQSGQSGEPCTPSGKSAPDPARSDPLQVDRPDPQNGDTRPDPEQAHSKSPTPLPDNAPARSRPHQPADRTVADQKTGTTGHPDPSGARPGVKEQTGKQQETASLTSRAEAPADSLPHRGTKKSALDQIKTVLAAKGPEGSAMRDAELRLMTSFQRAGLEEDAARAATVKVLARLQEILPSTGPLRGFLPFREQNGDGTPTADRFHTPRAPVVRETPQPRYPQGSDTVVTGTGDGIGTAFHRAARAQQSDRPGPGQRKTASPSASSDPGLTSNDGPSTGPRSKLVKPDQADPPRRLGDARSQVYTAALRAFAARIASDPTKPALPQLAQAFARAPAQVFEQAALSGDLAALAQLFCEETITPRSALTLLAPDQIRRLAIANPMALTAAVSSLSKADAMELVLFLLPAEAGLLRAQMVALPNTAKAPRTALHRAARALLQNAPLDIEALVNAAPAEPAADAVLTPSPHAPIDPKAPAAQTSAGANAPETPLQTVLALSGLTKAEIDRVLQHDRTDAFAAPATEIPGQEHRDTSQASKSSAGPGLAPGLPSDAEQAADKGSDPDAPAETDYASGGNTGPGTALPADRTETATAPEALRDDANLRAHLALIAGQEEQAGSEDMGDLLRLIWQVWPGSAARRATDFALLLATINAQITPGTSVSDSLEAALPILEPDRKRQLYALRTVAARLSHTGGPDPTGLRGYTRATVEALIAPRSARRAPEPPAKPQPQRMLDSARSNSAKNRGIGPREESLLITENAGLVLLHPYLALLFDRMKLERDGKALRREDLPRALGALQFLAGDARLQDPFHCVLLGVNPSLRLPEPQAPDDPAQAMMTGLLRSVIDNWGRLGKTSPDGLRETFLQRTGSLRFEETGSRLRVAARPFDMLLDALPWAISTVALPWMPLPCYVSWRDDNDA